MGYPAIALGAGAVLLAGLATPPGGGRLILNKHLRYLGKISYGLYMFHVVAIGVVYRLMPQHGFHMLFVPVSFALTIVLAGASYR